MQPYFFVILFFLVLTANTKLKTHQINNSHGKIISTTLKTPANPKVKIRIVASKPAIYPLASKTKQAKKLSQGLKLKTITKQKQQQKLRKWVKNNPIPVLSPVKTSINPASIKWLSSTSPEFFVIITAPITKPTTRNKKDKHIKSLYSAKNFEKLFFKL